MTRMTISEVRSLSTESLVNALILRKDSASLIQNELEKRILQNECNSLWNYIRLLILQNERAPVVRNEDLRPFLREVQAGKHPISDAAEAILRSGWDFQDPRGYARQSAEEMKAFLEELTDSYKFFPDLPTSGYKTLIQVVFDSYSSHVRMRQCAQQS